MFTLNFFVKDIQGIEKEIRKQERKDLHALRKRLTDLIGEKRMQHPFSLGWPLALSNIVLFFSFSLSIQGLIEAWSDWFLIDMSTSAALTFISGIVYFTTKFYALNLIIKANLKGIFLEVTILAFCFALVSLNGVYVLFFYKNEPYQHLLSLLSFWVSLFFIFFVVFLMNTKTYYRCVLYRYFIRAFTIDFSRR